MGSIRHDGTRPVALSVIVPTHDRCETLTRTLEALSRQTCPESAFEVLVIADACHDETAAVAAAYAASAPYRSTMSWGSTPFSFDFDIVPRPPYSTGLPSDLRRAPVTCPCSSCTASTSCGAK